MVKIAGNDGLGILDHTEGILEGYPLSSLCNSKGRTGCPRRPPSFFFVFKAFSLRLLRSAQAEMLAVLRAVCLEATSRQVSSANFGK